MFGCLVTSARYDTVDIIWTKCLASRNSLKSEHLCHGSLKSTIVKNIICLGIIGVLLHLSSVPCRSLSYLQGGHGSPAACLSCLLETSLPSSPLSCCRVLWEMNQCRSVADFIFVVQYSWSYDDLRLCHNNFI